MKGKWLWNGAFCFLIRNYHSRICNNLVIDWFEGICESFERIWNDGNTEHSYDGLLWVLRSLQELSAVHLLPNPRVDNSQSSVTTNELGCGWNRIWSCLIHGLPIFSNVTPVADAALTLLGSMITNELINIPIVPQDVWDLRLFKLMQSVSVLYFIACYFSRKGSQGGDLRDILHLRQNLLRSVLGLLNGKDSFVLNESVVMLLPAAMFSLCAGSSPFPHCLKGLVMSNSSSDVSEAVEDWFKVDEHDQDLVCQFFDCSVEVLAEIKPVSSVEAFRSQCHYSVRLPRQIWQPLLQEMETQIILVIMDKEIEKMLLSDIFFLCVFICSCIHGSDLARLREANSSFVTKMGDHLVKLLQHAVSVIEEKQNDLRGRGCLGSGSIFDVSGSTLASLRSFICSPLFSTWSDQNSVDDVLYGGYYSSY